MKTIVFCGAKAIAEAVGIHWRLLPHYVKEHGLPAFKIEERGRWLALPEDLHAWVERMRDESLKR
ncbi:hypothetical protein [Desulfobulbus elongatus]|uniref:hypothetical protein n=1 Tax=Desulfobulbus elongatus TaxID=53332 RepID=UPI000686C8C3|nr:hypothetical protein [Desulfobulbus elongatus]